MLKNLLIISLLVTIAGASAVGFYLFAQIEQDKYIATCRTMHGSGPSSYVVDYSKWLQLPEGQRGHYPWSSENSNITKERNERFIAHVDRLANLEPEMHSLAEVLYGLDWQNKVIQYQQKEEKNKIYFSTSITVLGVGLSLFVPLLIANIVRCFVKKKDKTNGIKIETIKPAKSKKTKREPITMVLKTNGFNNQWMLEDEDSNIKAKSNNLYTDSESLEQQHSGKASLVEQNTDAEEKKFEKQCISTYKDIKDKAHDIGNEIQKAGKTKDDTQALDTTLNRLTEEISAIRQYAGQQQDRVKKLQEGYGWKVIRSFGLRIIRCADNLERRISMLKEDDDIRTNLEEVRDELFFALESSGLERYEPEINSDYRGQEKTAEAIKDKQPSEKTELKGKIADIVRCGYKYVIDDENFKVVRTAQVKLFD